MGYVRFGLRDPRQADPGTILIDLRAVGKDIIIPNLKGIEGISNYSLSASSTRFDEKKFLFS